MPQNPAVIATTSGPGSFTSVRIQLATTIGLKLGFSAATFCPTTFDVLSSAYPGHIPAIDSFRGDYFCKVDSSVKNLNKEDLNKLDKPLCGDLGIRPDNMAALILDYYNKCIDKGQHSAPAPSYIHTPKYTTRL